MCSDRRRRNNLEIPGGHRCEAGILYIGIPVSTGYRLGDEEDGEGQRTASDGTLQD